MQIDTGLAVVIAAVLIFYLRLIIVQRERARRLKAAAAAAAKKGKAKNRPAPPERYSILSEKLQDRIIAVVGAVLILAGLGLYAGWLPFSSVQPYWWIPTAIGIMAFSWAFRL